MSVNSSDFRREECDNSDIIFKLPKIHSYDGIDCMIDVCYVGKNFNVHAPENLRFCNPSSLQDLHPIDDLA